MCREGAGSAAAYGGLFIGSRPCKRSVLFLPNGRINEPEKGGGDHVSGPVPQMAAQDLRRRHGPGPHHRDPAKAGGRRAGPPTPTSSPAPGAPARPPAPRSWPRPSTASTRWTATPATSAPPAWASRTAAFWTCWSWTPPPTTAWTRSGPCGTRPSTPPPGVKKRVYIVDEVHMLSTPAFNALLKILEEPPEHLMFILATTELHKVPATILSRCQRFSFKPHPAQGHRGAAAVCGPAGGHPPDGGAERSSSPVWPTGRCGTPCLCWTSAPAAGGNHGQPRPCWMPWAWPGNLQTAQLLETDSPAGRPGGAAAAEPSSIRAARTSAPCWGSSPP